jgi:hypothetical protein
MGCVKRGGLVFSQARGIGNEAEQPELCHNMYPPAILRLGSTSQSMRRHLFSIICSFSWGSRGGDANPFHSGHSSSFLPASVTPSREFLLRLFNPFLLSLSPLLPSFSSFFANPPIRLVSKVLPRNTSGTSSLHSPFRPISPSSLILLRRLYFRKRNYYSHQLKMSPASPVGDVLKSAAHGHDEGKSLRPLLLSLLVDLSPSISDFLHSLFYHCHRVQSPSIIFSIIPQ